MRWPYIISFITLLGAGLLLFFNILCGASNSSILGKFYWLEAQTSGISGAHSTTRWTNYNSCGIQGGKNYDCTKSQVAYPMSPRANFGTNAGVPTSFHSAHGATYYLSRVGWSFLLLGLLFTMLSILPVAFSFCLPTLTILGIGSGFATSAALLFTTISAALLTAAYVKARNNFKDGGKTASLGKKMFGFIWGSVALLFLSSLFSGVGCLGGLFAKKKRKRTYSENYDSSSHDTYGNNYVHEKREGQGIRGGFFRKNKNKNAEEAELENIGYHAGLGASGATSGITGGAAAAGTQRGVDAFDHDPEKLDEIGYRAGLGASGATSDLTQPQEAHTKGSGSGLGTAAGVGAAGLAGAAALGHHNKSKKNDTIPEDNESDYYGNGQYGDPSTGAYGSTAGKNRDLTGNATGIQTTHPETGETLDDVGYAAGLGASGATSDLTGAPAAASSKNTHDSDRSTGYSDSSKPYNTGAATGYDNKNSSSNKGIIGTAAAALGLGGGAAAASHHHNKNHNSSGVDSDTAYGSGVGGKDNYNTTSASNDRYGNDHSSRDASGKYGDDYSRDVTASNDRSHGYGTTAAGAGAGAAAGYALGKASNKTAGGLGSRGPAYDYDPEGTDTGEGATRAGINADKDRAYRNQYENKSTALPVGGGSHYNQDPYGNQTPGYDSGVPNNGAAAAAATAATTGAIGGAAVAPGSNSAGYSADPDSTTGEHYRVSTEGAAVRPEDTYKNLYANSKENRDVTDTSGYEPTNYYSRKTGQDFNTGKDAQVSETAAGDNVYGSTRSADQYGSTGQDVSTRSGAHDDSAASNAAKGGFFGSILGFGASKKSTDNSNLAERNSTSSSVYDNQSDAGVTSGPSNRETGGYGSSSKAGRQGERDVAYNQGTSSTGRSGYADEQTTGTNSGKNTSSINKETLGVAGAAAGAAGAYGASKAGKGKTSSKDATTGTGTGTSQPTGPKGETLDDVAYAAGYGASGATADTSKLDNSTGSKSASQPTGPKGETSGDVGYAAGYGASGATANTSTGSKSASHPTGPKGETLGDVGYAAGYGASGATANTSTGSKSASQPTGPKGETLGDVGYAAGYGASGATANTHKFDNSTGSKSASQPTGPEGETLGDVAYAAGYGASGATANTSKFDNSTGSGTGSQGKYTKDSTTKNSSSSGKKSSGIDKETLGLAGAAAGAAGAYGASKAGRDKEFGKARDVGSDTYDKHGDKINDYIGGKGKTSSKNATTGTSQATGPKGETLGNVAYAAGYGASGATANTSNKPSSRDPTSSTSYGTSTGSKSASQPTGPKGETLDDVAYAAGYGASGATANTSKFDNSTGSKSASQPTGPEGETLGDVAYAAGYGASGATADTSRFEKSKNTSGTQGESSKYGKDDIAAAKALGVGSATGAKGSSSDSRYSSKSGNRENIYEGSNTKSTSTGPESSANYNYGSRKGYPTTEPVVDPSRNRNPIAEGLTGTSAKKPSSAGPSSTTGAYGTSKQSTNVAGISNDDRSQTYGSTKSGSHTTGPSTAEKLESRLTGQDRSSRTKANENSLAAGKVALGAGALGAGAGAESTLGGNNRSSGDRYGTTSGDLSSSTKYKTTGADSSRRYEGGTYNKDDIPGTFPTNVAASSPTENRGALDSRSNYATTKGSNAGNSSTYGSDSYGNTNSSTGRTTGNEVEYDANGNPIQEETLLQKVVDTAKSVI